MNCSKERKGKGVARVERVVSCDSLAERTNSETPFKARTTQEKPIDSLTGDQNGQERRGEEGELKKHQRVHPR